MRTSGTGKSPADRGFTLVEVVVSLFVVSAALLILLATIQRGLVYLGETRDEFRAAIGLETAAASAALELADEEAAGWEREELFPLPGFMVYRVTPAEGEPGVVIWVCPAGEEEEAGGEDGAA